MSHDFSCLVTKTNTLHIKNYFHGILNVLTGLLFRLQLSQDGDEVISIQVTNRKLTQHDNTVMALEVS